MQWLRASCAFDRAVASCFAPQDIGAYDLEASWSPRNNCPQRATALAPATRTLP
ncbi:hypothetical protein BAUCODRAFT_305473 [Baudoinia panamericana UAMH 10762]|uniref:Uncharacterized protein n=1 Tax=Baudoinia panamericana (strain UAMH 10762) TaxID=717646 RepID=M2MZP0_BAUPA|nr:uncharacterized protein BAUCODRAFT_305473 [Baudoinia panamericana UAMH 10762]EMC91805.1 hypothetical protein BAUCODRAFT_305473 [Baudoinia panamericana UAMH 10762]